MSLTVETLDVFADVLTNMAAGWFATIIIFPGLWYQYPPSEVAIQLLFNLLSGIMSVMVAILLKQEVHHAN